VLRGKAFWGYVGRFIVVHLATYVLMGVIWMNLANYAEAFQQEAVAGFMRPVDDPIVALGIPMQILRGALLAIALWPFYAVIVGKGGWWKLALVLWVLTGIGAVITGPGSLEGMVYTTLGFGNPLVGLPEVTLQVLLFSWLLWRWERKALAKREAAV